MRLTSALALALFAIPLTSEARIVAGPGADNTCEDGMRKSVTFSTSFNGQEKTLAEARAAIDGQRKMLETAAQKANVTIEPSNYNYSISLNMNYTNGAPLPSYTYSGSMNYQMQSEDLAKKLSEELDKQKRQFSVNVNASHC